MFWQCNTGSYFSYKSNSCIQVDTSAFAGVRAIAHLVPVKFHSLDAWIHLLWEFGSQILQHSIMICCSDFLFMLYSAAVHALVGRTRAQQAP